jgi:enterochelin esterase-like enzyme
MPEELPVEQELRSKLISPEVHPDRRVTFRLRAPQAGRVVVHGIAGWEPQPMTRSPEGIWEVTLGPLAPELHSYVFDVDGTVVTDPHNRAVKKWLSVESLFEIPGEPPLCHQRQPVPHGVVHHHVYPSKSTGCERGVYVYTPPGYSGPASGPYGLVILLHGYGDDESAWLEVGRAHWIADNLLARDRIKPMVIAMPHGHPLPIERQSSFDDYTPRNADAMEREILEDLLPNLASWYPLTDSPECRAIAGLSMGGWQALRIGLRRLDRFAWIGGFSTAPPPGPWDLHFDTLPSDAAVTNQWVKLLWLGCGQDDFLVDRNERLAQWLRDRQLRHTYQLTPGGHDWSVWRTYLAAFLPLLGKTSLPH